ncbi:MAG: PadR family transcriptional regulator [Clostridiaceae bacterium]|nr:PadR family transcriptional regulator [Clostridiaceae bacterium]
MHVGTDKGLIDSLRLELRRGTLVLSVLSRTDEPKYGYALVQSLLDMGVPIDPNTLYPLLRRLESQGLLISEWETDGPKPRKYYRRTPFGTEIYRELRNEWNQMAGAMELLMKEES